AFEYHQLRLTTESLQFGINGKKAIQFHPEFERAGIPKKNKETFFVVAPEQPPAIDQFRLIFDQAINISVEIRGVSREMMQRSGPALEGFIHLASNGPGRSFLPPKIGPLRKEIAGDREIALCGCA